MKIQKKTIIIILNVVVLLSLLYFQSIRYAKLINYSIENQNHNEVLRNVSLLHAFGNDINWIIITVLILLVLNIILFKNWIKAKRWIIEPFFIFLITTGLTITYHINRFHSIKEENKNSINNELKQ